jgi:hypothetical protein
MDLLPIEKKIYAIQLLNTIKPKHNVRNREYYFQRNQNVVIMKAVLGMTYAEIGEKYSISLDRVRQIYEKSINTMRGEALAAERRTYFTGILRRKEPPQTSEDYKG